MMTAEEALEAGKGLTFEKVWVVMQDLSAKADQRQAELTQQQAETSRQIREIFAETEKRQAETSKQIKELSKETDKQIKELSRNIGGLSSSFGKWAEEMISAKLWEKFRELGYTFTRGGPEKFWEGERTVAQVDMLLENGEYAMPVEIKSVLTERDVNEHLERMRKVREQLDKRGDGRKLVGAVAGMAVASEVREYAQRKGLYVLVQSGDSVVVAEMPENFKAREW
ncbi:MAG: hypothetical protein LBF95_02555 [Treponema sp.]|jgi:hypothetical protein|nr:hypothetical protein [Treponema sp.]